MSKYEKLKKLSNELDLQRDSLSSKKAFSKLVKKNGYFGEEFLRRLANKL